MNLQRSCQSLLGRENQPIPHNAGNYYRNRARHVAAITSLMRIEIANCPPIFPRSSHTILVISDLQCQSLWLVETRYGPRSASRLLRSRSGDGSCGTRAEAYAIVVRELAARTAQAFVAHVPAESLPFRAAIPKLGLSQRSRDRPRRVAEMFFASRARAGQYTFSGAQRAQRCGTHLQGWAPRPPVFPIGSIFAPRQSAHPKAYGFGVAVCAIASVRNCRQSWSAKWTSATVP